MEEPLNAWAEFHGRKIAERKAQSSQRREQASESKPAARRAEDREQARDSTKPIARRSEDRQQGSRDSTKPTARRSEDREQTSDTTKPTARRSEHRVRAAEPDPDRARKTPAKAAPEADEVEESSPPTDTEQRPLVDLRSGVILGLLAVGVVVSMVIGSTPWITPFEAMVLGAVEGITEFLPVSSTGHLLVVERMLGLNAPAAKEAINAYTVVIQIGAIIAVVGIYRERIMSMLRGLIGRDDEGRDLLINLVIAFLPAAVIGLALNGVIKSYLFGVVPVIIAWFVGGVFLLVWKPGVGDTSLNRITRKQALIIGSAQVLALWPGTSRSLVTIVAALAVGVAMSSAVEFSFLLGLATLSAATLLDVTRHGDEIVNKFGIAIPLLGMAVAGLTAFVAVNWFVAYLRTQPLKIFGWYRVGIAAVTAVLVGVGAI